MMLMWYVRILLEKISFFNNDGNLLEYIIFCQNYNLDNY